LTLLQPDVDQGDGFCWCRFGHFGGPSFFLSPDAGNAEGEGRVVARSRRCTRASVDGATGKRIPIVDEEDATPQGGMRPHSQRHAIALHTQ
jgi:hypothetical protein